MLTVSDASLIVKSAPPGAGLVVGQRIVVESGMRLGRAPDCELKVEWPQLQRLHLMFEYERKIWWARRMEASTFIVNGAPCVASPLRDGDEISVDDELALSFRAPVAPLIGDVKQDGLWLLFSPMRERWCYAQHVHDRTIATAFSLHPELAFAAGIPGAPRLLTGTQSARVVADIAGVRMSDIIHVLSKRGDGLEASIVFAWLEAALSVACRGLLVSDAWITFDGRVLVVGTPENVDREEWAAHLVARGIGALGAVSPDELAAPSTELGLRIMTTIRSFGERAGLLMQLLDLASQGAPIDAIVKNVAALVDALPLDRRFAQSLVAELFPREAAHDRAVREEIALRGLVDER
jgi:hypothetical protein